MYQDCDIPVVIDRFASSKVDAVFFPHCNFGSENRGAQVAVLKVAMKELAKQYNCKVVAIQCRTSLQDMADIMPCHANALLTDEGIPTKRNIKSSKKFILIPKNCSELLWRKTNNERNLY